MYSVLMPNNGDCRVDCVLCLASYLHMLSVPVDLAEVHNSTQYSAVHRFNL